MKDLMAFALNCNCIARRADRVVSGGQGMRLGVKAEQQA